MDWQSIGLVLGWIILIYVLSITLFYILMMAFAYQALAKRKLLDDEMLDDDLRTNLFTKPVSILVPAYNEEAGIVESLHSLINLRYPESEIIVIDDGSKDSTAETVIEAFSMKRIYPTIVQHIETKKVKRVYQSKLHPKVFMIMKENGGKADALNTGINLARYPYFCSIDGDSILDENSLLKVMRPIIASDGKVVAAGGNVRIANGNDIHFGSLVERQLTRRPVVMMQIIEYLRAFMLGRIFLSRFNMVLIISGAFSVFSKRTVIAAGGYTPGVIGEDMELVVKVHEYLRRTNSDERIEFVPEPVCWTEAPTTLRVLRRQRRRWSQGLIESLWRHKHMTLNPKYGRIGLFAFPYFWLFEALGAVVELGGYIYIIVSFFLGTLYVEMALMLMLALILYGSIFSSFSLLLEAWTTKNYTRPRTILAMVLLALSETFWYRPLTLFWRLEGIYNFMRKNHDWGRMERQGLGRGKTQK
ncbi:glycosyltransferase family 2 protein [Salinicoccus sp. ID82-1]|uniref:glycosyltransferase family 2 protein n=1 Tax=Salinicoccus sp. ID82-1 TaxID=2820269 RepID=UPI001F36DD1C|nr:glycosyltransferase [Salinicoccus sp. ID82-1]MCG1010313.1 glycosyltransferase family 2 protein [Salinicoccus sp. ID82-1]